MFPAHCDTLKKDEQKLSSRCPACAVLGPRWVGVCRVAWHGSAGHTHCPSVGHPAQVGTATEPRARTRVSSRIVGVHVPAHACPRPSPHQGNSAWADAVNSSSSGSDEPSSTVCTAALGCSVCEKDIINAFNFMK